MGSRGRRSKVVESQSLQIDIFSEDLVHVGLVCGDVSSIDLACVHLTL